MVSLLVDFPWIQREKYSKLWTLDSYNHDLFDLFGFHGLLYLLDSSVVTFTLVVQEVT